jgi:hypothetical protein
LYPYRKTDPQRYSVSTDGFGDSWFQVLEVGIYLLEIKAKGFKYDKLGKNHSSWFCHLTNKNIIREGG